MAARGVMATKADQPKARRKPKCGKRQDASRRNLAASVASASRWTRTINPLIKSHRTWFPKWLIGKRLGDSGPRRAPNAHQAQNSPVLDQDLAKIVGRWRELLPAIRAGIIAMIEVGLPQVVEPTAMEG